MVRIITDETCSRYSQPGHPERPERILAVQARLRQQTELALTWAPPLACPDDVILRAHSAEHLARLAEPEDFDADTPFLPGILDYARTAAGAALAALRAALAGETVLSLMRPPGHHATRQRAMGFCYLNNLAIAVLAAIAEGAGRVAVFDFDVHHANGTEAILLNRDRAWVASVHQFPGYPGTGTRNVGRNCFNYPLLPQTPRGEYRQVLTAALAHLLTFRPSLVAVSAGFDAYARDPLAQMTLEAEDYYWLGQGLRQTGLPVLNVLEGGYSAELPDLILAYLNGLAGK